MSDMKLIMENWEKFVKEEGKSIAAGFESHKWENAEQTSVFYEHLSEQLEEHVDLMRTVALEDLGVNGTLKEQVTQVYTTLKRLAKASAQLAKY